VCNFPPRDFYENRIFFNSDCSSHRPQCKIKGAINQEQMKILKFHIVGYIYLINPLKRHHVYRNRTINLRDMKYGRYTLNTLMVKFPLPRPGAGVAPPTPTPAETTVYPCHGEIYMRRGGRGCF
jgi:hypothetical protein